MELIVNGEKVPWFYVEKTKAEPRARHPGIPTTPKSRNFDVHAPTRRSLNHVVRRRAREQAEADVERLIARRKTYLGCLRFLGDIAHRYGLNQSDLVAYMRASLPKGESAPPAPGASPP